MVSSRPKQGTGPFFKIFQVLQRYYNADNVFLTVNASLRRLINDRGVYLVQVSFRLLGQRGLGHFFRNRPFLPIGWTFVQIVRKHRRKTTNTAENDKYIAKTLSAIQAASQSTIINEQLYSPCD
jgi:hypothetical protein